MQADYVGQDRLPEDCQQCVEHERRIESLEGDLETLQRSLDRASTTVDELENILDNIRIAGNWRL